MKRTKKYHGNAASCELKHLTGLAGRRRKTWNNIKKDDVVYVLQVTNQIIYSVEMLLDNSLPH